MKPEEFAEAIDEIKKLTPIPGEFIVVRLKGSFERDAMDGLAGLFARIFPKEQKVIIIDNKMDVSTIFGRCLHCGSEINPNGV